jgi:hypothetical protein
MTANRVVEAYETSLTQRERRAGLAIRALGLAAWLAACLLLVVAPWAGYQLQRAKERALGPTFALIHALGVVASDQKACNLRDLVVSQALPAVWSIEVGTASRPRASVPTGNKLAEIWDASTDGNRVSPAVSIWIRSLAETGNLEFAILERPVRLTPGFCRRGQLAFRLDAFGNCRIGFGTDGPILDWGYDLPGLRGWMQPCLDNRLD